MGYGSTGTPLFFAIGTTVIKNRTRLRMSFDRVDKNGSCSSVELDISGLAGGCNTHDGSMVLPYMGMSENVGLIFPMK